MAKKSTKIELYVGKAGRGPLEMQEVGVLFADIYREGRGEWSKTLVSNAVLVEETQRNGGA